MMKEMQHQQQYIFWKLWLYTTTYTLSLWLCFIVVFEAEHGMDKRQKIMLFHYPGC